MALIWRCASAAAKQSLREKQSIQDILRTTGSGWEIPDGVKPPEDATAKELAEWIRNTAREKV